MTEKELRQKIASLASSMRSEREELSLVLSRLQQSNRDLSSANKKLSSAVSRMESRLAGKPEN